MISMTDEESKELCPDERPPRVSDGTAVDGAELDAHLKEVK
jgi:hypothetical protein